MVLSCRRFINPTHPLPTIDEIEDTEKSRSHNFKICPFSIVNYRYSVLRFFRGIPNISAVLLHQSAADIILDTRNSQQLFLLVFFEQEQIFRPPFSSGSVILQIVINHNNHLPILGKIEDTKNSRSHNFNMWSVLHC